MTEGPEELRLRIAELEGQVSELRAACVQAQRDLVADRPKEDILSYLRRVAREQGEQWSRETIIDAIREWNARYGKPPSSASWAPSLLRARGREKERAWFLEGRWPHSQTVRRHFGSWALALEAAGFGEHPIGRPVGLDAPRFDENMPLWEGWHHITTLRKRIGMTVAELSRRSGCGYNHLRDIEAGEKINPTVRTILALAGALEVRPAELVEGPPAGLGKKVWAIVDDALIEAERDPGELLRVAEEQDITFDEALVASIRYRLAQMAWEWAQ